MPRIRRCCSSGCSGGGSGIKLCAFPRSTRGAWFPARAWISCDRKIRRGSTCGWLRGKDLNLRPLGYEPNELPDCSTPHTYTSVGAPDGQIFAEILKTWLKTMGMAPPQERSVEDIGPEAQAVRWAPSAAEMAPKRRWRPWNSSTAAAKSSLVNSGHMRRVNTISA